MDILEDLCSLMRLESLIHGELQATAPWGIRFQSSAVARFGLVVSGNCWLTVEGLGPPIALRSGDCYLMLRPQTYTLSDAPGSPARPYVEIKGRDRSGVVRCGGGGAAASIIVGRFEFDRLGGQPLIDLLCPLMYFPMDDARAQSLQTTLDLLAKETKETGLASSLISGRLADIVFLQAIRAYAKANATPGRGWLAAVSDPQLRKALLAIHGDIGHPWTLESLSVTAGMSRSAFAARFTQVVGEPCMSFLARLRMHRAKYHLLRSDKPIAAVAEAVGYETPVAFSKTFRRAVGVPPAAYRRDNRTLPRKR